MRLVELHLKAFGPFTDQVLSFGTDKQRLVLVHGLNEAGKSSTLRAIEGLRFGIPARSTDKFLHDYKKMQVGGVFVDAQGARHSLMRRKGTGVTLKFVDFSQGGVELPEAVPSAISRLLTGGLSVEDYQSMFGLNHETLRKGGMALVQGEGEIGAALFEASSGVGDVSKIRGELEATAKKFFMSGGNAKNGRINQALTEYKMQFDRQKEAQIKPSKWEAVARASRDASEILTIVHGEMRHSVIQQHLIKELIAVSPILASLARANAMVESLEKIPLLSETASAERAAAEAGQLDATSEILANESEVADQRALIDNLKLDPVVLDCGQSIARLHAAAIEIAQLRGQAATAESDIESRTQALNAIAAGIEPTTVAGELVQRAPTATGKAAISECISALEEAERALVQHRGADGGREGSLNQELLAIPEDRLLAALRVVLEEVKRSDASLRRLSILPMEIKAAEQATKASLAAADLPDEAAARKIRPLLGATVDAASQQLTMFGGERADKVKRVSDMRSELARLQGGINELLARGPVPTHEEVQKARVHRQEGWTLVKTTYITGEKPDISRFTQGRPLPEVYEQSVIDADSLIDLLAVDTSRVATLEAARQQLVFLERDLKLQLSEIQKIDDEQGRLQEAWQQTLTKAGIPSMPPAELRDWQERLSAVLNAFAGLHAKRDELEHSQEIERSLVAKLREAVGNLGFLKIGEEGSLGTLVAIAEDNLKQVAALVTASNLAAGQALEARRQADIYNARDLELVGKVDAAKGAFSAQMPDLLLGTQTTVAMAKARLAEFDELLRASAALDEALSRRLAHGRSLSVYQEAASNIAATLSEAPPTDIILAAEIWSARLARAQEKRSQSALAKQKLDTAEQALSVNKAKASRHLATLEHLCAVARVKAVAELPEAEDRSNRKRLAQRDALSAADQLASASRRTERELQELIAGRDHSQLRDEESRIEQELVRIGDRLDKARVAEEVARRELDDMDSSDTAAVALDAMESAAATVRSSLPLYVRATLAHALLGDAVSRFMERSQAPMLRSASEYFSKITDGEFQGLINDDSSETPVIAARRPSGDILPVDAMSEGTRDQLFLALRLAALKLQRDRGVDLPVILDDVLMASDDFRAGCIFKALAEFSQSGQVIVFTHHHHLCEVARKNVDPEVMAFVELKRA